MSQASAPGIVEVLQFQLAFQRWATGNVLDAARNVEFDALRAPGVIAGGQSDGSVFETLAHLAASEEHWLRRLLGTPSPTLRTASDYGSLEGLRSEWTTWSERLQEWLAELTAEEAAATYSFHRLDGTPDSRIRWQTLLHLGNHSTHHRAEACTGLSALGAPPEGVDMIDFIREAAAE